MHLALPEIRRVAAEVVAHRRPSLNVVAVTPSGANDYAELVVTIEGCVSEPCRLVIGVSRNASEATLRQAIDSQLVRHLAEHEVRQLAEHEADARRGKR